MSIAASPSVRAAVTSTPILGVLADRWSPRSYDPASTVSDEALTAALEAARWSPSANNIQPWRFIVARRGSHEFDTITGLLMGFNQAWASSASALIVGLAEVRNPDGKPQAWASYDLGQAIAHLSVQAHHDGLHVHQMGGFDADGIRSAFNVDARLEAISVSAIGILGTPEALPDALREREVAPRTRLELDEIVLVNA